MDVECVAESLQLELTDLQCKIVVKDSFNPQNFVYVFKSLTKNTFPNVKEFDKEINRDDVPTCEW